MPIPKSEACRIEFLNAKGEWEETEFGLLTKDDIIRMFRPDGTPVLQLGHHELKVTTTPQIFTVPKGELTCES